jgi:hypothetical protein
MAAPAKTFTLPRFECPFDSAAMLFGILVLVELPSVPPQAPQLKASWGPLVALSLNGGARLSLVLTGLPISTLITVPVAKKITP